MIEQLAMTGSEIRIDNLEITVDLTNPDLDTNGIREGYGRGKYPQIMFESPQINNGVIYIMENSGDPAEKQYPLYPGRAITLDYSEFVKAKNIFYVVGTAGDTLSIVVR